MAFETGNSGSLLKHAVIKTGKECQQEGAFCQYLGKSVCPEIYALIPNGYVMERLFLPDLTISERMLLDIEMLLEDLVWCRSPLSSSLDQDWRNSSKILYGLEIPDYAIPEHSCLVHGDPTHSNILYRESGQIVICDPRPPRAYVPQAAEIDMAKIMQSYFGWETAAYNWPRIEYKIPNFWYNHDTKRRVKFWLKASLIRIKSLVGKRQPVDRYTMDTQATKIVLWCDSIISGVCDV